MRRSLPANVQRATEVPKQTPLQPRKLFNTSAYCLHCSSLSAKTTRRTQARRLLASMAADGSRASSRRSKGTSYRRHRPSTIDHRPSTMPMHVVLIAK